MSDSMNSRPDIKLVPLTEGGLELELSEMECLSIKTLLDANSIQAIVVSASPLPNLPNEILVPASQLQEAIRIIRDSQKNLPPPITDPA